MKLENRKARIGERLRIHGIADNPITFLPYLEFDSTTFVAPYEVGCRSIILYAIVYTIEEPTKKVLISKWLKSENIWKYLSHQEAHYLEGNKTHQKQTDEFSWQLEAAYILAWALNLVKEQPSPNSRVTDQQMEDFLENIAPLGNSLSGFLNNLSYRNTEEIFEENIFYELTTAHFRDLLFNDKKDATDINRAAAFERHKALNWLRRFMDIKDWQETDTST